jgi:hypothetical protein
LWICALRLRGEGLTLPIYSKLLLQAVAAVRWGRIGLPQSKLPPAPPNLVVPYWYPRELDKSCCCCLRDLADAGAALLLA